MNNGNKTHKIMMTRPTSITVNEISKGSPLSKVGGTTSFISGSFFIEATADFICGAKPI